MIATPELDWMAIAPELVLVCGAMAALLAGMGRGARSHAASAIVAMAALLVAMSATLLDWGTSRYGEFAGQIHSDDLTNLGRLIIVGAGIVVVIFAWRGREDDGRHAELHALLLAACAGMGLLVAASSFVTLFVGLELFSIALYVLCSLDADRASSLEAGIKYLIVGGMSGAMLLYGSALVYGATGSLEYGDIASATDRGLLLHAGLAMVLAGMAFKVSAAPLHWWTPDVYEGAGTVVTAFMATATKVAAFLALTRLLAGTFAPEADVWVPVIAALAVASIVIGNLGALAQSHVKRMLAYSSIAQAGYLLGGLVAWEQSGVPSLAYALVVYAVMSLGAFAYVIVVERDLGRDATFADLAGRGWVDEDQSLLRALPAIGMTICALSLAGIPPTAGFFAKAGLFNAMIEADYAWLAVVAAVGSVVSLGYYLRIIVELYMRSPDPARSAEAAAGLPAPTTGDRRPAGTRVPAVASVGVLLAAGTLLLAIIPGRVFDAGCDVQGELTRGAECTSVEEREASLDAAPATPSAAANER